MPTKCSNCGNVVIEQAKFCPRCGGAIGNRGPSVFRVFGAVVATVVTLPFAFLAACFVAVIGGGVVSAPFAFLEQFLGRFTDRTGGQTLGILQTIVLAAVFGLIFCGVIYAWIKWIWKCFRD